MSVPEHDDHRPLRIAMVGQKGLPATWGGIEHHVEQVGRRLAERGHEVTVYCRGTYGEQIPDEHLGMRLRRTSTLGTKSLDAIVHSATSSLAAVAARADVVHYHAIGPGLVAPLPRYLTSAGVVLTVHGLDHARDKWGRAGRAALGAAHLMSPRVPHELVVVSQALQQHYRSRFGRETVHVPNGVTLRDLPADPTAVLDRLGLRAGGYALFVGRLVPEKRPDLLLRAFARVPTDKRLVLAGDSSFTDDYVAGLTAATSRDPRVVMAGFTVGDDLAALYAGSGAVVQPSSLEGLPLTLLEAIGHDAPVVASDIAPHVEVLGAGSPRHLLFPVDDEDALVAALTRVLADPGSAAGADARRCATTCSPGTAGTRPRPASRTSTAGWPGGRPARSDASASCTGPAAAPGRWCARRAGAHAVRTSGPCPTSWSSARCAAAPPRCTPTWRATRRCVPRSPRSCTTSRCTTTAAPTGTGAASRCWPRASRPSRPRRTTSTTRRCPPGWRRRCRTPASWWCCAIPSTGPSRTTCTPAAPVRSRSRSPRRWPPSPSASPAAADASPHRRHEAVRRYSYLARSRYGEQLARWFDHVDRDRVLVLRTEDLAQRPQEVLDRVHEHVGLPAWRADGFTRHTRRREVAGTDVPDDLVAALRAELEPDVARLTSLLGWERGWW